MASGRRGTGVSFLGAAVAGGCDRGRTGSRSVTASRWAAAPRRDTVSRSGSRRDTVSSRRDTACRPAASRWGLAGFRSARSRDRARGAVGWAAGAGLAPPGAGLACPFLDAAGLASPAGGLGSLAGRALRAAVASGLSEDSCAQYCSSVSLSHSMLGQSSSSRLRERPFGTFCPLPGLRRESERSRPGSVFGGAGRVRARAAGISSEGKSAAGNSLEAKSASGSGPEANSSARGPAVRYLAVGASAADREAEGNSPEGKSAGCGWEGNSPDGKSAACSGSEGKSSAAGCCAGPVSYSAGALSGRPWPFSARRPPWSRPDPGRLVPAVTGRRPSAGCSSGPESWRPGRGCG